MNQIVISDFWTSKKVLSSLYNSEVKGNLIANKLFGEPLSRLVVVDEAHLSFNKLLSKKRENLWLSRN